MDKNCLYREDGLRRWGKSLDRAEKKLDQILFLKDTASSHPPPRRVKVVSDEFSESELIPSYFFEEVSTADNSIPSAVDEEDDSLNLGFIPSIFINAKHDLSADQSLPYEIVAKTDVITVNRSSEFQLGKLQEYPNKAVNEFDKKNQIGLGKNSTIILSSSRSIFDPGKDFKLIKRFCYLAGVYEFGFDSITSCSFALYVCSILMDECDGNSVYELLFKNGYWADSWCGDSIVCSLTNGGVICTAEMLFDKMSESTVVNLSNTGVDLFWKLKMSRVFDRGKEIDLLQRYSQFSVGLKLLDGYYRRLVQELLYKHGYQLEFQFICSSVVVLVKDGSIDSVNSQVDESPKTAAYAFVKISQIHINEVSCAELQSLKDYFFIIHSNLLGTECFSLASDYFRSLFDRGKPIDTAEMCYSFGRYISKFDLNSCLVGLNGLTFMDAYYDKLVYMLMCEIKNVRELFHQMLEMWEEENFLFQMKYVLPEVLLVCQVESWGVDFFRILQDVFKPATEWMGFSLSSLRLTSTAIQEEVIKKSLHYTTDGLLSWYFTQHKPSCCQPWSSKLCMRYQTKKGYGRMPMIQLVLIVPHALIVSKLVDSLRWKYKFYPTGLESATSASWTFAVLMWMTETQLILRVIKFLQVQLLWGYLQWKFRMVSNAILACQISGTFNTPAGVSGMQFSTISGQVLGLFISAVFRGDEIKFRKLCSWWSSPTYQYTWAGYPIRKVDLLVGYLRWKFKLVPPELWSVRTVSWIGNNFVSVFSLDAKWTSHSESLGVGHVYREVVWRSGEDNIGAHSFPNTIVALTYEWLRGSAGTLRKENSVMTSFCLCVMRIQLEFSGGLTNTQFSLVMFQDPTVLVSLIWVLWKRYLAANGDTELAYVQVRISMWINVTVAVNLQENLCGSMLQVRISMWLAIILMHKVDGCVEGIVTLFL